MNRIVVMFVGALGLASPVFGQTTDIEAGLALFDCLEQDNASACDTVAVAGPTALGTFFEEEDVSDFYGMMEDRIPELIADRRPACDANDHIACFEIANLLAATDDDPPMESFALLVGACDAGIGMACIDADDISLWSNGRNDQSSAFVFYKEQTRACDDGNATACVTQARLNTRLRDVEADPDIWKTQLEEGCEANIARACTDLSNAYGFWGGSEYPSLRTGVRALFRDNLAVALTYAEKACDLGNPIGCWNASGAYGLGDGVAEDLELERIFNQRACQLGMFVACGTLSYDGDWYLEQDTAKLQQFCDAGDQTACYVGFTRAAGLAAGIDSSVMTQLENLCLRGAGDACADAAKRYYDAGQFAKSEPLAFASCNIATYVGCGVMGDIYRYQRGTPEDLEVALDLYRESCGAIGTETFCIAGADIFEKGLTGWKDADMASELYWMACEMGSQEACDLADTIYDRID